ncbi:MAG: DUF4911 domain-containing protein [Aquificota bacterium]|nr:DUF4911 domain-containing protein [Aquificota bacterium]
MREKGVKARILTVKVPVSEVGLLNALLDGAGRIALARTRGRGEGLVDLIASPDRFAELISVLEGMKKHIRGLEIIGESDEEDLNF